MHAAVRTTFAAAIAVLAAYSPHVRAAPLVAAPTVAPTNANPPPATVAPQTQPATVPRVGTVQAPIQLIAPAKVQVVPPPASPASWMPTPRALLRDAVLLTGPRYVRTLVVPSSGTIQVIAELRGSCDATLSIEPTALTGGDRLALDLQSPAANSRHGATLLGQRVRREYQVTTLQVANGGSFRVSVTPVAATLGSVASELSFEINLE